MQKLLAIEGNDNYGLDLLIKNGWVPIVAGSVLNFKLYHDDWCPRINEDGICCCNVEFFCEGYQTDD